VIQTFVAQPFQVKQQSMEATLHPEEYVLVDKLTPRFTAYERGDIIVFDPVHREGSCEAEAERLAAFDGTPYIKRVIGEPGDTVELQDGAVVVNRRTLEEGYVDEADTDALGDETSWLVPPNRVFVLGDNRANSVDSRSGSVGLVCARDIVGRAVMRYWPLNQLSWLGRPSYPESPELGAT
jgi:signal peptidase I